MYVRTLVRAHAYMQTPDGSSVCVRACTHARMLLIIISYSRVYKYMHVCINIYTHVQFDVSCPRSLWSPSAGCSPSVSPWPRYTVATSYQYIRQGRPMPTRRCPGTPLPSESAG